MKHSGKPGIDPLIYLKARSFDRRLPWDTIETGASKDFLLEERRRASSQELTPDCRDDCVNPCGNCDFKEIMPRLSTPEMKTPIDENFLSRVKLDNEPRYLLRFLHTKRSAWKYLTPIDFDEQLSRAFYPGQYAGCFYPGL